MLVATARQERIRREIRRGARPIRPRARARRKRTKRSVRPTPASAAQGSNDEQKKLYALIRARALASQMTAAKIMRTKLIANRRRRTLSPISRPTARACSSTDGSRPIPMRAAKMCELPKVTQGEPLTLVASAHRRQRNPAAGALLRSRPREGTRKRGIGRPSTYASHHQTLGDARLRREAGPHAHPDRDRRRRLDLHREQFRRLYFRHLHRRKWKTSSTRSPRASANTKRRSRISIRRSRKQ